MQTYHLRIKKDYAAAVIEDLQKMDAVELVSEKEIIDLSESQKQEVLRRIEKYKNNPELLLDEQSFFKMLDQE